MTKKILLYIGVVLLLGVFVYLALTIPSNKEESITIRRIETEVITNGCTQFVHGEDLQKDLLALQPQLIGMTVDSLDLRRFEKFFLRNKLFKEVNICHTTKGTLRIKIKQHNPLFVVVTNNEGFFVTHEREMIPLQGGQRYAPTMPVIHGKVSGSEAVGPIYNLLIKISADPLWQNLFTSYYLTTQTKELIAQTRIEQLEVNFGTLERWDEKLWQLNIFVKQVISRLGWNAFKSINLEFPNRLITVPSDGSPLLPQRNKGEELKTIDK